MVLRVNKMKFVVNMIDSGGKSKIKIVEAFDIKEASSKAKKRYPSYEVGRITKDENNLDYYSVMKNNGKKKDI
jgi:hypothetical protein